MKKSELPPARVESNGDVVVPADLVRRLGLHPGDAIAVHVTRGGIWLRPEGFDPGQWRFWTPEWQEGEEEIEEDRAAGRTGQVFESDEAFLAHLKAAAHD